MPKTPPENPKDQAAADKLREGCTQMCQKIIDTWEKGTAKRRTQIQEYELTYYGNVRPSLMGRSNFPFPVMAKYVDELKGRLDELPSFRFEHEGRYSQLLVARKIQAAIDKLKKPQMGDWARQDRMARTNSIFAGYAAYDFATQVDADKGFMAPVRPIDHNDFVFEMFTGSDLEKHTGIGEFPLFRNSSDLDAGVASGLYDAAQVKRLKASANDESFKKTTTAMMGRFQRYKAIGLDIEANTYIGQQTFGLAQMQVTYEGKRYLNLFDYATGISIRFEPLREVFKSAKGEYSIKLYQTHEDPNVVMCKAPVDDMYSISEGMRLKVNQVFDASTKQLWSQTVYDPNFFPDPSQLEWKRPDQLIVGRAYGGQPISNGLHKITTSFDFGPNIEFVKWLDTFLAQVVGINPAEVSEEKQKVGVLFGQLQKSGARLGVQNKSYSEMWSKGLRSILHGMKDNMDEEMLVKLVGSKGVEWDTFAKEELGDIDDFGIIVEGSTVEAELNEAMMQRRSDSLKTIIQDPDMKKEVSPRWLVEQSLKAGKFPEEEIRRATDTKNYGSEESIARADLAIELILKGKSPKPYVGADVAFMQYILDYANRLSDADKNTAQERIRILHYGLIHRPIVVKNMAAKAAADVGSSALAGGPPGMPPGPGNGPPGAPPGSPPPMLPQPAPAAPGVPPAPPVTNQRTGIPTPALPV